jgi:hypothetical protein
METTSIHPYVAQYQWLNYLTDVFLKFGMAILYKKLASKLDFHACTFHVSLPILVQLDIKNINNVAEYITVIFMKIGALKAFIYLKAQMTFCPIFYIVCQI